MSADDHFSFFSPGRQEKTPIAVFSFLNFCRMKLVLLLLATAAGGGAHAFVTDFEAMKSKSQLG
jgi:hypothetical protein